MLQLMPGLLYVIVITAVFTILLIGFTAVFLLSQARAIVRKRYLGPIFSEANTLRMLKVRPSLVTIAGVLISVKDESTSRLLTIFKRPAELRLYDEFFYVRPFFSSSAYLIPLEETLEASLVDKVLVVMFQHDDHRITLRCRSYNIAKWFNALNRRIEDINSVINNKSNYPVR
ncbi:MAG: hypothetical protein ACXV4Z_07155 [Halobacteriota archaeon]